MQKNKLIKTKKNQIRCFCKKIDSCLYYFLKTSIEKNKCNKT